ncbi:MAG: type II toxin-antitoxin system RelE/ParE family toxin [Planctomycetaceae bacterium]|nr:type II toxin-antitoxin system RelE/ParE family toxin [Planctomycetaceae bacterium]
MKYRVGYRDIANRQLRKLPASVQNRVIAAVDKLASNPRPPGCRKLQGRPGYRIRIGDYRVVYEIHDQIITVEIIGIGHRKDIYR